MLLLLRVAWPENNEPSREETVENPVVVQGQARPQRRSS